MREISSAAIADVLPFAIKAIHFVAKHDLIRPIKTERRIPDLEAFLTGIDGDRFLELRRNMVD